VRTCARDTQRAPPRLQTRRAESQRHAGVGTGSRAASSRSESDGLDP
jgi:hypothetical protein